MTFLPRSLFHRNLLLIVVLIVVAQLSSAGLFRELVMKPRVRQAAMSAARHIQSLQAGLSGLSISERSAFIARMNAREQAASRQLQEPDQRPPDAHRLTPLEQVYLDQIAQSLAVRSTELVWRREQGRVLSVQVSLDGVPYWLTVPGMVPGHVLSRAWVWGSIVSALLAIGGAWLIQRRLNQPLNRVMDAARALGRGERPPVLPEDGPAEIATVSKGFNEMAAGLARHDKERTLMLAGLSHDLRTPLTKIRLATEMLKGQGDPVLLNSLDSSINGMEHLLVQFMDFIRAGHDTGTAALEPLVQVDVNDVVREVVAMCVLDGTLADDVTTDLGHTPRMALPVQDLRRVLINLVVNAQRHGRPPVTLRTRWTGADLLIEVMDRGPGIATHLLDHVRQPFAQGDEARSGPQAGAGLGLAIVERIAKAHHARLALLPRDGGGLIARLTWPAVLNS